MPLVLHGGVRCGGGGSGGSAVSAVSAVTGGCHLNPSDSPLGDGSADGPVAVQLEYLGSGDVPLAAASSTCCTQGCCEYVNIASRCSLFADGLPPCSACMARTSPPATTALASRLHRWSTTTLTATADPHLTAAATTAATANVILHSGSISTLNSPSRKKGTAGDGRISTLSGAGSGAGSGGLSSSDAGNNPTSAYLEMFKAVVLNSISRPSPEKVDGHKWPAADSPALSMVGRRRLDHVHALIDDVVLRGVPGDFAECGCWKGGVAAVAAAVLRPAANCASSSRCWSRRHWSANSNSNSNS